MRRVLQACFLVALLTAPALVQAQQKYFQNWPENADPHTLGARLAARFVASDHLKPVVGYPEVCTWYGALTFAEATHDTALRDQLIARYQQLLTPANQSEIPDKEHVDFEIFGAVPLQIAIETGDAAARQMGLRFADRQWANPTPDGLAGETRFWVDDMFMLEILQLEAYRATHDAKYLDRAAKEMVAYLRKLQQPSGLFYHAPDVPFYWGRGNGWFAAGMSEMLLSLPENHPDRPEILAGYKKMMAELKRDQNADGTWRELIDHPESWEESSSTGMFTFAMIEGVRHGWLDEETYGPVARRAWIALAGFVDQNADVTNVCAGTNKKNSYEWYMDRPRRTGDFHGQAPVLWAARALLQP
ncbi:MAG TPA: glycoside hydrolase family 88 protein [Acidobacteriaceae bacterium]|nr:glycoside hydrolase family 88 protein [Acidobacteriaceae bacterium]